MKNATSILKHSDSTSIGRTSIFRINFKAQKISIKGNKNPLAVLVLIGTFVLLIAGALLVYYLQSDFEALHLERLTSTWGISFLILTTLLFLLFGSVFVYNLYHFLHYKPIESVADDLLPTCTVIVPA